MQSLIYIGRKRVSDPPDSTECIHHRQRLRQKISLSAEQELEPANGRIYATQIRIPLQYNDDSNGISGTEYVLFLLPPLSSRVRNSIAMNARLEGLSLWDRDVVRYLDSDRIPIFNPIEDFLFGLDVRWDGHDRIRELAARLLQQPTLGGLVLSLVSEYGGTLAADRPEICELHCTIARRSAGLPKVYFLPEFTSSRITGILHGPH